MTSVKIKQPFPVKIGPITLYCDKMTLSARSVIYHTPTVLGVPVKTNKCRHFTYLTFMGKVYDEERPMRIATLLNNFNGVEDIEVSYKGAKFTNCMVTGIKAEDSGGDHIDIALTLATSMLGVLY